MFARILVPTDGTPLSHKAVLASVRLAKAHKGSITFLNVQPECPYSVGLDLPVGFDIPKRSYQARAARRALRILEQARAIAVRENVQADVRPVLHDKPWQAICEAAAGLHCDLVVMASHSRQGLDAIWLGSQTQKVLAHCRVPVLIYR